MIILLKQLFKKEEIPQIETKYFVLAPILAGEIDLDLLNYLYELYPDKLCMDIQGFVRMIDKEKDEIYFCNLEQAEKKKILTEKYLISGSAVVPNLEADQQYKQDLDNIRLEYKERLNSEKAKIGC